MASDIPGTPRLDAARYVELGRLLSTPRPYIAVHPLVRCRPYRMTKTYQGCATARP